MTERTDVTGMTDAEKADLYAEQVKDMQDRAPRGDTSGTASGGPR